MCVPYVCLVPKEARISAKSSGTGLTVGCKLPCGFWKPDLGPLQKYQVLLTVEPLLWP